MAEADQEYARMDAEAYWRLVCALRPQGERLASRRCLWPAGCPLFVGDREGVLALDYCAEHAAEAEALRCEILEAWCSTHAGRVNPPNEALSQSAHETVYDRSGSLVASVRAQ